MMSVFLSNLYERSPIEVKTVMTDDGKHDCKMYMYSTRNSQFTMHFQTMLDGLLLSKFLGKTHDIYCVAGTLTKSTCINACVHTSLNPSQKLEATPEISQGCKKPG